MSENTKIQWATHTFNPWMGCSKVSPGCKNCYAESLMDTRYGKARWGKGQPRVRTSAANWGLPMKWNRQAKEQPFICHGCGTRYFCESGGHPNCNWRCTIVPYRPRVFCASLADWLDDEIPIEWLADLLKLIHDTPNLDWLLLTKRPENFWPRIGGALAQVEGIKDGQDWPDRDPNTQLGHWLNNWHASEPPANIWIGTSVEDQQRADDRIPELLKIPARVRFLSVEPMLGPIDFTLARRIAPGLIERHNTLSGNKADDSDIFGGALPEAEPTTEPRIHWAIFGGESGPRARPCCVDWIRYGVRQCMAAGVAPFVKQLGADVRCDNANEFDWPDDAQLEAAGEGFAACRVRLNDKKGGDTSEWPDEMKVREFPT